MRERNILLSVLLPLSFMVLLSACVAPSTVAPEVSKSALEEERIIHQVTKTERDLAKALKTRKKLSKLGDRVRRVQDRIEPAAAKLCVEIFMVRGQKPPACIYDIEIIDDDFVVNAYADGDKIYIYTGMIRFTKTDEELAYIIAHELAHNFMQHVQSTKVNSIVGAIVGAVVDAAAASQGVDTRGSLAQIGSGIGGMAYSAKFEEEADYVATYILARAGYNTDDAANIWRRMSARDKKAIYITTTHPVNPKRTLQIKKTSEEIARKRKNGERLIPNLNSM